MDHQRELHQIQSDIESAGVAVKHAADGILKAILKLLKDVTLENLRELGQARNALAGIAIQTKDRDQREKLQTIIDSSGAYLQKAKKELVDTTRIAIASNSGAGLFDKKEMLKVAGEGAAKGLSQFARRGPAVDAPKPVSSQRGPGRRPTV